MGGRCSDVKMFFNEYPPLDRIASITSRPAKAAAAIEKVTYPRPPTKSCSQKSGATARKATGKPIKEHPRQFSDSVK